MLNTKDVTIYHFFNISFMCRRESIKKTNPKNPPKQCIQKLQVCSSGSEKFWLTTWELQFPTFTAILRRKLQLLNTYGTLAPRSSTIFFQIRRYRPASNYGKIGHALIRILKVTLVMRTDFKYSYDLRCLTLLYPIIFI